MKLSLVMNSGLGYLTNWVIPALFANILFVTLWPLCISPLDHVTDFVYRIAVLISDPPRYETLHNAGLECIRQSHSVYRFEDVPYSTIEDRKKEFFRILELTAWTRSYPWHSHEKFSGPWLEDLWFYRLCCDKDMTSYGPYVPIFVPWTGVGVTWRFAIDKWTAFVKSVLRLVNPRFLYITVIQYDWGIEGMDKPTTYVPGNLVFLSSGGKGHVPLMLNMGTHDFVDPLPRKNSLIFMGKPRAKRNELLNLWKRLMGDNMTILSKGRNWKDIFRSYDFVFSPRGNGRNSFRTTEVLEMGLIPVISFRKRLWVPYLNSTLPWEKIAFHTTLDNAENVKRRLVNISRGEISEMRANCRMYKNTHFTVGASVAQISLFMKFGSRAADLRCDRYYVDA